MSRKIKYSKCMKLRAVKAVLQKNRTIRSVSREIGASDSQLEEWIKFYRYHGPAGLDPRPSNATYTLEFKLKVIRSIDENGLSFKAASVKFNVPSDSTVRKWYLTYLAEGVEGIGKERRGRAKPMKKKPKKTSEKPLSREEELLKENESLKAELALLKKLHALAQAKKKKQ